MAIQTFVADTILTAAQMNALQGNDYNQTVSTKTASYTLVAADKGTKIVMNSASATTITVNTSLFSAGDTLTILNIAAGVCTVTAGTATVSTSGTLALVQNAGGTLYFTSAGVSVFEANGVTASASGLVFITGATFTTATNFSLAANSFSATYKNYRILINVNAVTADVDLTMRLRAAGTDASSSDYQFAFQGLGGNGTADNATSAGTTSWTVGDVDSGNPFYSCSLDIMQPQATGFTSILGNMAFVEKPALYSLYRFGGGVYLQTTSFDSLSFISSVASSISGNYRVYGYAES